MADFRVINDREFNANMRRIASQVATDKEKQSILLAGAVIIRKSAKYKIPVSKKTHFYYPRNNIERTRTRITPGNLANSIRAFRRRDGGVDVGPRVLSNITNYWQIGETPRRSSGYYAAALFGSANAFRRHALDSAFTDRRTTILSAMAKRADKIVQKYVNRL